MTIRKGKTREMVKRHVSSVIPLLKGKEIGERKEVTLPETLQKDKEGESEYLRIECCKTRECYVPRVFTFQFVYG